MEIKTFLSLNCPECNEGQFRVKKSLDLSNYEIFPHKILKSRTFKKSSILIVIKIFKFLTKNPFRSMEITKTKNKRFVKITRGRKNINKLLQSLLASQLEEKLYWEKMKYVVIISIINKINISMRRIGRCQ